MESFTTWKIALTDPKAREAYKRYVAAWESRIGSLLEFDLDRAQARDVRHVPRTGETSGAAELLAGLPIAVKDNIAVEGFHLTCGSRMLEGLVSPYTATAVRRLEAAGAIVVGKSNLDEFGMGSSTENSALKTTSNPWDPDSVAGGSSGGSAAAVAAGIVPIALGSDTGGSIRQPAAFCGVYGLKPTYGAVSRYGLVAYASSLEGIGLLSCDLGLARASFEAMRGIDPLDHTSVDPPAGMAGDAPAARVGILDSLSDLAPEVEAGYRKAIETMRRIGFAVQAISLPTLDYGLPAYYTIATAEASANLARFNGIRYGRRPEFAENPEQLVRQARDEGFGGEVKLRILLGTYVLRSGFQDQYYIRAQKIRTAIRNDFARVFEQVDVILMPVFPTTAFKRGEGGLTPFQQKLADKFTVTANLAGIPALSFPVAVEKGLPVGMQFLAPPFREERLFRAAEAYAREFPLPHPPGYSGEWST